MFSALFILSMKGGEIMALKIEIDESEAMDGLGRIDTGKDKAMKATRSDFRSRNASAVERGVQAHYNIKSGRVRKDKKAWRNVGDYGGEQDYTSSPLGLGNFGLTPRQMPKRRTRSYKWTNNEHLWDAVRMPLPYTISFAIKNGTSTLGPGGGYFVRKGNVWKRTTDKAKPIERVSTLSVAAMITNDAKSDIEKELEEFTEKRFTHNVERFTS